MQERRYDRFTRPLFGTRPRQQTESRPNAQIRTLVVGFLGTERPSHLQIARDMTPGWFTQLPAPSVRRPTDSPLALAATDPARVTRKRRNRWHRTERGSKSGGASRAYPVIE